MGKIWNMKHLVFVGPQGSGKTTSVGRIARELNRSGFEVVAELKDEKDKDYYGLPVDGQDFYVVLKRGNSYVLCYSWSDINIYIIWLENFIKKLTERGINLNLVVMASRPAPEWMYTRTEQVIGLTNDNRIEIPLGKITARNNREESLRFYLNMVFNLVSNQIIPQLTL